MKKTFFKTGLRGLRSWVVVWMIAPWTLVVSPFSLVTQASDPTTDATKAISPRSDVIRLFNGKDLEGLYTFLEDTKYEDPRQVFSVRDGMLVISGDGFGGVITKETYRDYHLICEFKWGLKTWRTRKISARDSGILVHGNGPDDSYLGRWITSHESQIIEGGMGDLIVVNGTDEAGQPMPISLTAEVTKDRDGETVWKKGGARQVFHTGCINWFGRDPDWNDALGFSGANDIPGSPDGWIRMEVICNGSNIQILVDGVMVNEGFDANPSSGKITIQAEAAEMFVRRWELWPINNSLVPVP